MSEALPRLSATLGAIVDNLGVPTRVFTRLWDQFASSIENAEDSIEAAQAQIEATQTEQAAQLATITTLLQSVSFAESLTISATAGATNTTISISANSRVYLDKIVAVNGGTVAGVPYGTDALLYYDDPTRAGGAVTYEYTTDPTMAPTSSTNPGRVYVGEVITPANSGAGPSSGVPARSPTRGAQP